MKPKAKTKTLALTPTQVVEANATQVVIRREVKLEDGKILPTKYATLYKGMVLGAGGRLVPETKFVSHFSLPRDGRDALLSEAEAKAEWKRMNESYQQFGKESLTATSKAVESGDRVISRVFWNFAKGTNVIETKITNDNQKIIDVAAEITQINGKPIEKADALAFARSLLQKAGEIKQ